MENLILGFFKTLFNFLSQIQSIFALVIGYLFAKYQFKFESIHKRRLNVIEEAYSKIRLADRSFRSMTNPLQMAGEPDEVEKERVVVDKINEMLIYLDTKRLFFSSEEQKSIDLVTEKFFKTWNLYQYKKAIKEDPALIMERTRLYKEIWDSASKEIPDLFSSLEKIFKKELGLK